MPRGNPSPKLAITVDPDVHRRVVAAAAAEGVSVSAWITSAARQTLLIQDGIQAVREWEADNGAFTDEEMEEAHRRVAAEIEAAEQRRSA
jgi:HicB family